MEAMVNKTLMKVIGFAGSLFLTIFAGMFALISLSAFIISIIERDFFSVVGCAAAGFLAWVCWSVRRDVL